jgi:hypothetical protein
LLSVSLSLSVSGDFCGESLPAGESLLNLPAEGLLGTGGSVKKEKNLQTCAGESLLDLPAAGLGFGGPSNRNKNLTAKKKKLRYLLLCEALRGGR